MKKIAFLSDGDPRDKSLWSGTMYMMYSSFIQLGYEVDWIPATKYTEKEINFIERVASFHEKILNRTFNRYQNLTKAFIASRRIKNKLKETDFDLLFVSNAINDIAFLNIKQPIIYVNDILYDQHINYYSAYKGLGWYSKKILRYLERKALQKCSAVLLPSEWSVERAVSFYHLPSDKVHLLRFGANIDVPQKNNFQPKKLTQPITFLFLSVEWERKRGDIALDTVELLVKKGYNVKLKVVGCIPPKESEIMEVVPFLNKNIPEDYQKLKDTLNSSHFLFVPTEAECYGIVFCEASAYGLPSITTATGGVTSIVKDGINGFALPLNAKADEYAKIIEPFLINESKFQELSKTSRARYDQALNWDVWRNELRNILNKIFEK
ncbi:glycosyltransferase family 4 protein [Chishuiella sp.]|uniref:glycosyltransferase family 4 protein n=1 Tax=Chishuiella sp. TaxID=1969467 RepID=UPI0028ACDCBD|nr:glycosyltransferase family 4 protein [Chishuiella sp.]